MSKALKSIWQQVMADDVKPFRLFFVLALFLIGVGLLSLVVASVYLDWYVGRKLWGMEFILIPFEVAMIGFFHGLIVLWGSE